jgi:hypothetical protein
MRAEIFWIEGRLAVLPRPRGSDWLDDEVRSLRACGVDVLVSLLTSVEFVSFPVVDRGVPTMVSEALGLVQRLVAHLSCRRAVAIHCRQGVGRSALVAACVLASFGETPDAAFERIARARGCSVPDTPEQREWVQRFADRHLKGTTLLLSTRTLPAAPGLVEGRGWAVVEFNPAWCSGLLGADPAGVLGVLERAMMTTDTPKVSLGNCLTEPDDRG